MDNQPHIPEEEFMKDAEEGLSAIRDEKRLSMIVDQINQELHKKLEQKKARKNRRKWKDNPWTYLAIVLIIFLVAMGYWVIHKLIAGE